MATKLWDKGIDVDAAIEEYTVGNDRQLDMRLARYDVQGSMAHIRMLESIGLLTADELEILLGGLHLSLQAVPTLLPWSGNVASSSLFLSNPTNPSTEMSVLSRGLLCTFHLNEVFLL